MSNSINLKFKMGIYDAPEQQLQDFFIVNPLRANIAVIGNSMSGKTTFVKTFLVRMHQCIQDVNKEQIYCIDFGGSLGKYGMLPNVCACFDDSNEENIKRIFKTLETRVKSNRKALQQENQNFVEAFESGSENCPPHLTLIIENLNAFISDERYSAYQDPFLKLCRDGLSSGLSVLFTASSLSGLGNILPYFSQKIGFSLDKENLIGLFGPISVLPMNIPGRGIMNLDSKFYEFQCFLPYDPAKENDIIDDILKRMEETERKSSRPVNPNRLKKFEDVLTVDNFKAHFAGIPNPQEPGEKNIVLGLEYYEHKPICLNIERDRGIGIYGKRQFGKTNLLHLILDGFREKSAKRKYVYLGDGRFSLLNVMQNPPERKNLEEHLQKHKIWISADQSEIYTNSISDFLLYLTQNGYIPSFKAPTFPNVISSSAQATGDGSSSSNLNFSPSNPLFHKSQPTTEPQPRKTTGVTGHPVPTVFVIDSKSVYQSQNSTRFISQMQLIFSELDSLDSHVIFAEIRPITDLENRTTFNSWLDIAFVLADLGAFLSEKGDKTALGDLSAQEMKSAFAPCEIGDGYYYGVGNEQLYKMKFIKSADS